MIAVTVPRRSVTGIAGLSRTAASREGLGSRAPSISSSVTATIASRSATEICLLGGVDLRHAVGDVHAVQAALVEDVRVGAAADLDLLGLEPCSLERAPREDERRIVGRQAVTPVLVVDRRLDLTLGDRGGERERVERLLDELRELALVARAGVDGETAAGRHDVESASALDQAGVRGRLLVDAAEPEIGDRARRRDDRRASVLRVDPRVGRTAREDDLDRLAGRRRDDDLADGSRVVVDEAHLRLQPGGVEGKGTLEARLLPGREEELDARVPAALGEDEPGRLEDHGDRRLVVGSEDRVRLVRDDPVRDDGLDRPGCRHRVEMRAEEDRAAGLSLGRGQAREEVAGGVALRLDAQVAQVGADMLRDGLFFTGRARDGRQLEEEREDVRGPGRRHGADSRRPGRGRADALPSQLARHARGFRD